jgi:peptidoglycan/LPS O-acetylase OafA/YrhL
VQPPRLAPLDVLRFFAIFFVLLRHVPGTWPWAFRFGWSGVDLFFVLSGFLVTGLLFGERRKRGRADVVRFLVRRAFKIYPSFWALVAATAVFFAATGERPRLTQWACELLFLQNYGPSIWSHTWSLAVEEHFYLLLALGFAGWQRRADGALVAAASATPSAPVAPVALASPAGFAAAPAGPVTALNEAPNPAARRALLFAGAAALATILVSRCLTVLLVPARYKLVYLGTHVRVDGLICGALIASLYHTDGAWLRATVRRHRRAWLGVTALGALPAFVLGLDHAFTRTLGFTFVYLFYGAVLLATLFAADAGEPAERRRPFVSALAFVGRYSYGIYLWHPLANDLTGRLLGPALAAWPFAARLALYLAASIAPGVALSRLIEEPFLALRDRLFPRRA